MLLLSCGANGTYFGTACPRRTHLRATGIFAVKSAGTLSALFITVEHSPAEAGKENPRLLRAGDL